MYSAATPIIIGLAVAWLIQYALAYWQMRRFYRRVGELRQLGTVSIGMEGSAWRRRQYAVLVVDPDKRIVHAEQFSGWTVAANLRPVQGLEGYTLEQLGDDAVELPISQNRKLVLAFRNAAQHILAAEERIRAKQQEAAAVSGT